MMHGPMRGALQSDTLKPRNLGETLSLSRISAASGI